MTLIANPALVPHINYPQEETGSRGHHLVPVDERRAGKDTGVYTTLLAPIKMNVKPDFVSTFVSCLLIFCVTLKP